MKTLLILLWLWPSCAMHHIAAGKREFHIQVDCFTKEKMYGSMWYCISYTDDNWSTSNKLMEVIDYAAFGVVQSHDYSLYDPDYITWLSKDKAEAIQFAKKLKSFALCENYNAGQYKIFQKQVAHVQDLRKKHDAWVKANHKPSDECKDCCKKVVVY